MYNLITTLQVQVATGQDPAGRDGTKFKFLQFDGTGGDE